MRAGSYTISNLFVAVCIISFHFFDSDSASPTAQLEWGLRIILWRSVLELLKVNTRSCLIVIYCTTILYKSVTDDRVFFQFHGIWTTCLLFSQMLFIPVTISVSKLQAAKMAPSAPKIMLNMLKHMRQTF